VRETDQRLLSLIKTELPQGKHDAFEALLNKYEKRIYTISYRYFNNAEDALDMAQEAAIKVFNHIAGVTMPEDGENPDALNGWICTVTAHTCLDELRRRKRRPVQAHEIEEQMLPGRDRTHSAPSAEDTAVLRERAADIINAVTQLPDDFKTMIILRDMQGLTYNELSEAVGIPINTVKSRLSRARSALKKLYDGTK